MPSRRSFRDEERKLRPGIRVRVLLLFSFFLVFSVLGMNPGTLHPQPLQVRPITNSKRILVLYTYRYGLPAYQKFNSSFIPAMESGGLGTEDMFFEYLDLLNTKGQDQRQTLVDMLRHKYSECNVDLIVTMHSAALKFLLNDAKGIFPNVPILSWVVQSEFGKDIKGHRLLRLQAGHDVQGTLSRALELFPRTSRVIFICGVFGGEYLVELEAKKVFENYGDKLQFEYTSGLSVEEMLKRVSRLPPHTIVIYYNIFRDKTGRTFIPRDVGKLVAGSANMPVFGLYDTLLGLGIIGGSLLSFEADGARAGELALGILNDNIEVAEHVTTITCQPVSVFDWQQIERWGGKADNLPRDSIFVNRPNSFWGQYYWHILGLVCVSILQSLFLVGLLIHRGRRKSAEESLNKTEAKFRTIFDGAMEGIFETSPHGKPLTANPALAEILGYDSTEDLLSSIASTGGQLWADTNERSECIRLLESHGAVRNFECQFLCKNKSKVWVSLNTRRVTGTDGRVLCYSGFCEDITERKRIEQALAESRAQILAVVDSTNDLIWSVDPVNFGIVTWNKAFADYFLKGRGIELRVGMTPKQLVPPDFAILWHGLFSRALREGSFTTEYRVVAGTIILLLSLNLLKRDGEVFGISIFGKDITERKKVEDALKCSEEKYRALVETSADWVWEVDANLKYTYADPKIRAILGYEPEEVIGRTPFQLMPEEEARRVRTIFAQIAAERRPFSDLININLHRDGQQVTLETSGVPMFGPEGDFIGYRGMDRDITERKQAEDALRQHGKDLMVLTGRLISTQEEELRRLSLELHDDLTQRLAVLAMEAGMIEQHLKPLKTEAVREARDLKLKLIEVSEDVHNLSRQVHPSILDDLGLAQALRSEFAIFTRRTRIALFFAPGDVPSEIPGDIALCLYRVVQEGLRNIATHAKTNEARIVLQGSDEKVSLLIQDFGIGFDVRQVKEKAGIGLASMRERVRLVGGTISVRSEPGEGTEIEVSVPLGAEHG